MNGAWLALAALVAACAEPAPTPAPARPRPAAAEATTPREPPPPVAPVEYPASARVVAIGDVHGDLDALRDALLLGGAIDTAGAWRGGALTVVQVGDLLDRGDDEPELLALVARLEAEARAAGGRFLALVGNHEVMNASLDFRYVTPEGFSDFAGFAGEARGEARRLPASARGRAAAFMPGGHFARVFAGHPVVARVGDTLFVHGGLVARWARGEGLERPLAALHREAHAYFLGEGPLPAALTAEDGPVWSRDFAAPTLDDAACAALDAALVAASAARMVVGHTVQEGGVSDACGGRVVRIDVGLAAHYGGPLEVLELTPDGVRTLRGERPAR